jgi:hypothetical protein
MDKSSFFQSEEVVLMYCPTVGRYALMALPRMTQHLQNELPELGRWWAEDRGHWQIGRTHLGEVLSYLLCRGVPVDVRFEGEPTPLPPLQMLGPVTDL